VFEGDAHRTQCIPADTGIVCVSWPFVYRKQRGGGHLIGNIFLKCYKYVL
jgi:hypothetical protein